MPSLLFAPFTKIEETPDGIVIEGYATTERVDVEGQIVDYDSVKACLPDYAEWGNIREMHQPIAAGKALLITPNDEERTVFLRALIVDTEAQKKVRTEVYKGFSIGGKASSKLIKRTDGSTYTRRYAGIISEISLADRPANPETRFSIVRFAGGDMPPELEETQNLASVSTPPALDAATIDAIKRLAGQSLLSKAATDPAKIVGLIQAARNELELAGDMEGAALMTQAIALIQQASGEAEGSPAEEASEPPPEAAAEGDVPAAAMVAAAKAGNLKKAGRPVSGARMAALEQTVKTLLQMMAGAGSAKAQKAITAMADGDEMSISQAIGTEFAKAVNPLAGALLNINDRLLKIEAQPLPGGPLIRQPVTKTIIGQAPIAESKPALTPLVRQQLDNLQRMARTAASPHFAKLYDDQYQALKTQYQD